MKELIEKKCKAVKAFRIYFITVAAVIVILMIIFGIVDTKYIAAPPSLGIFCLLIPFAVYMDKYQSFNASIKLMKALDIMDIVDDINLDRPTIPRSKIYCGEKAFFSKKPLAIVPYSEIAWVYKRVTQTYGITVEKLFVVNMSDGKAIVLKSDEDEFKWLLENCIIRNSPDVIIGYGSAQKKKYSEIKKANKKR